MSYITLQTTGITTTALTLYSDWQPNGNPIVNTSGEVIPEQIVVQQLLAPTGLMLTAGQISGFFSQYPRCT